MSSFEEFKQKREEERQERQHKREEAKRAREKRRAQRRAALAELTTQLDQTLKDPMPYRPMLERQTKILDELLTALMRKNLKDDIANGSFDEHGLSLALRVQKSCLDTAKASAAIEYMQSIQGPSIYGALNPPPPGFNPDAPWEHGQEATPLPPETEERNE